MQQITIVSENRTTKVESLFISVRKASNGRWIPSYGLKPFNLSLQSFAYDTEELQLIWDSDNINAAKKENNDALFMDISLVNNMPKFKIIDHGYNFSTTKFMLNEEGPQNNRGTIWKLYFCRSSKTFLKRQFI